MSDDGTHNSNLKQGADVHGWERRTRAGVDLSPLCSQKAKPCLLFGFIFLYHLFSARIGSLDCFALTVWVSLSEKLHITSALKTRTFWVCICWQTSLAHQTTSVPGKLNNLILLSSTRIAYTVFFILLHSVLDLIL